MSAELRLLIAMGLAALGWAWLPAEPTPEPTAAPLVREPPVTPVVTATAEPSTTQLVATLLEPTGLHLADDTRWLLLEIVAEEDMTQAAIMLDTSHDLGWTDAPGWGLQRSSSGWRIDLGAPRAGSTTRVLIRGHALQTGREASRPSITLSWRDKGDVTRHRTAAAQRWRQADLGAAPQTVLAASTNARAAHELAEAARLAPAADLAQREEALHAFLRP